MTHQFYCHYTGKDGITPRRRLQQLTFFDHVPAIGNSSTSPTPLWAEVFDKRTLRHPECKYIIHAQLSDTVAVYVEQVINESSIMTLNAYNNGYSFHLVVNHACENTIALYRQLTDLTSYLLSHPDRITPHVLAAYKEARPEEYQKLQSLYMY